MKNVIATFAACMLAVGISAQTPAPAPTPAPEPTQVTPQTQTTTQTTVTTDPKTVTLKGCVTSASEPSSFLLTNVITVPAGIATATSTVTTPTDSSTTTTTTGAVGTSGSITAPTLNAELKYALIGDGSVDLMQHLGHQVEITGMVVPAANTTVTSSTTTADSTSSSTTVTKDVKVKDPVTFNVTTIKMLSETCPAR